jgi:hypothetical protein
MIALRAFDQYGLATVPRTESSLPDVVAIHQCLIAAVCSLWRVFCLPRVEQE